MIVARWVFLIPAVLVAAASVRLGFLLIAQVTFWPYLGPMHFASRLFVESLAGFSVGAAATLVALVLAPAPGRKVSPLCASIIGVLGLTASVITFLQHDYWAGTSYILLALAPAVIWFGVARIPGQMEGVESAMPTA